MESTNTEAPLLMAGTVASSAGVEEALQAPCSAVVSVSDVLEGGLRAPAVGFQPDHQLPAAKREEDLDVPHPLLDERDADINSDTPSRRSVDDPAPVTVSATASPSDVDAAEPDATASDSGELIPSALLSPRPGAAAADQPDPTLEPAEAENDHAEAVITGQSNGLGRTIQDGNRNGVAPSPEAPSEPPPQPSNAAGEQDGVNQAPGGPESQPTDRTQCLRLEEILPGSRLVDALTVLNRGLPFSDVDLLIVLLGLVSALTKLGTMAVANVSAKFKVPTNLFVAIVGDTGLKKSVLMNVAIIEPLKAIERWMAKKNDKALAAWKGICDAIPRGKTKPARPIALCCRTNDYTGPSLDAQLQAHEAEKLPLLIYQEELSRQLTLHKKDNGDEQRLLALFDGSGNNTLRMTGNRTYTSSHCSVVGAIQDEVLATFHNTEDSNGFFARFLFWPIKSKPTKLPITSDPGAERQREDAEEYLRIIAGRIFSQDPRSYVLCEEAIREFAEFEYECQQLALEAAPGAVAALKGKTAGKVLRVTALLHIIDCAEREEPHFSTTIPVQHLRSAIRVVEASEGWATAFIGDLVAGQLPEARASRLNQRIHDIALKKGKVMSWPEIRRKLGSGERKGVTSDQAAEIFQQLVDMGIGELSEGPRGGARYQATKAWPAT